MSKKRQIELVLKGELRTILAEKYGARPHTTEQIRNSIDFTREEALEQVIKHGFPPGSYTRGARGSDGIHLDKDENIWEIYHQDRGGVDLRFESADPDETREALMDLMIYLSGLTGIVEFKPTFNNSIVKAYFISK